MKKNKIRIALIFLLFFVISNVSAQNVNVTFPDSDTEKDNWQIINDGNTIRLQYSGNKRVKSVKFSIKYSVTVSAPKIPRISFDSGNSDGEDVIAKFQTSQVGNLKMIVTGDNIEQSELILRSVDDAGNGTFKGELLVNNSISLTSSLNGIINIDGDLTSSTSIDDLVKNCQHSYKTVGMTLGNTDAVELVDDYFYFYIALNDSKVTIDDKKVIASNFTQGSYYVYPSNTAVTYNDSEKTLNAGKLYNVGVFIERIQVWCNVSLPYVWGRYSTSVEHLQVTIYPDNASNKSFTVSANSSLISVNNWGDIRILAPNETSGVVTVPITVTAADGSGVTATYSFSIDNCVCLLGLYWNTTNMSGTHPIDAAQAYNAPTRQQFTALIQNCTISGNRIISRNGSGAYITLPYGDYWSCTGGVGVNGYYLAFYSNGASVSYDNNVFERHYKNIRLIRR